MSPTSRNTLMVGGALIVVALLLVCGPLSDQFGSGGPSVDETPDVAAGPPAEGVGAMGAAAVGALAGATLGEAGVDPVATTRMSDSDCAEMRSEIQEGSRDPQDELNSDCPPVIAGGSEGAGAGGAVAVVAATASAAASTATTVSSGAKTRGTPPSVSAAGPGASTTATKLVSGLPDVGSGLNEAVATASTVVVASLAGSFDDAFASLANENGGVGAAGPVVNRFPPPVAAPAPGGFQVASSLNAGALIMPCDTPGSGCRNVSGGNPPIVPGGPPPIQPPSTNPPIVPGGPPPGSQID